jgi:hypothetical protein
MWQEAARRVADQKKQEPDGPTSGVLAPLPVGAQPQPLFSDTLTPEEVKAWLLSKHSTLWGRSITLHKEGVQDAIDFFIGLIKDFEEFRNAHSD